MGSRILAGRYELMDKIGEGGMAVVFKSRDRLLNRFVAIKILRPEYTKDMMFIESFRRESQIAAGLVHPNIVNIYDVGKEGNIYYIVMELIDGKPLSDIIAEEGALDPHRAADIAKQVASALSMAHKHQLIHRDVKPHNIMITSDGVAKITDFGIAKQVNNGTLVGEQKEAVMGSVHYFSPEQARGAYVDEKSDIYSLGIVLYEMLTGKVPFDGDTAVAVAVKHMNEEMVPPTQLNPNIPRDLEEIVMKATSKLQNQRYRSADEMITALNFVKFSRVGAKGEIKNGSEGQKIKASEQAVSSEESIREGSASEDSKPSKKGKKKKFNWAYVVAVLLAIVLAFPASAAIKYFTRDRGVQDGDSVVVPKIVGYTLDEAAKVLEAYGLTAQVEMELQSEQYAAGQIMSQTPKEGASVKAGQTIKVNVSVGIVDGEVPSVIGKALNNAKSTIETYKYKVGEITEEVSEDVPKGAVISQSPVAGSPLAKGNSINLVVSLGTQEEVSLANLNVEGMSIEEATKTIEGLKLKLGDVSYSTNATVAEGCVISQNPSPGADFKEGDTIDLVVSKGKEVEVVDPGAVVDGSKAITIWIDYAPAVNEDFVMTITVSDSVGSPRTPYNQVARTKSSGGENVTVSGSGNQGKILVFFDNAFVYEYDIDFENGTYN